MHPSLYENDLELMIRPRISSVLGPYHLLGRSRVLDAIAGLFTLSVLVGTLVYEIYAFSLQLDRLGSSGPLWLATGCVALLLTVGIVILQTGRSSHSSKLPSQR
jgi:hypothetical protein